MRDFIAAGEVKALLEISKKTLEENHRLTTTLSKMAESLKSSSMEMEDLRSIVLDLAEVVDKRKGVEWLSAPQLAKELGVCEKTIRNWAKEGDLPGHRLTDWEKGQIRFCREEVDEFIRNKGI